MTNNNETKACYWSRLDRRSMFLLTSALIVSERCKNCFQQEPMITFKRKLLGQSEGGLSTFICFPCAETHLIGGIFSSNLILGDINMPPFFETHPPCLRPRPYSERWRKQLIGPAVNRRGVQVACRGFLQSKYRQRARSP